MKYLLLGNSNAARASDLFISKDHAIRKERKFVKCTSAMAFKLQVKTYYLKQTVVGRSAK